MYSRDARAGQFASVILSAPLAGWLLLPDCAQAFTCDQVIWAVQHFSQAELDAMASRLGSVSQADRDRAQKCLQDAAAKGVRIKVKVTSAPPQS